MTEEEAKKIEKKRLKWHRCPKCGTENFWVWTNKASCGHCDWKYEGDCYIYEKTQAKNQSQARS